MNRNIPKKFNKNETYYSYSEIYDGRYRYYYRSGWRCESTTGFCMLEFRNVSEIRANLCFDETFITREEYEDMLLIQELKK